MQKVAKDCQSLDAKGGETAGNYRDMNQKLLISETIAIESGLKTKGDSEFIIERLIFFFTLLQSQI